MTNVSSPISSQISVSSAKFPPKLSQQSLIEIAYTISVQIFLLQILVNQVSKWSFYDRLFVIAAARIRFDW